MDNYDELLKLGIKIASRMGCRGFDGEAAAHDALVDCWKAYRHKDETEFKMLYATAVKNGIRKKRTREKVEGKLLREIICDPETRESNDDVANAVLAAQIVGTLCKHLSKTEAIALRTMFQETPCKDTNKFTLERTALGLRVSYGSLMRARQRCLKRISRSLQGEITWPDDPPPPSHPYQITDTMLRSYRHACKETKLYTIDFTPSDPMQYLGAAVTLTSRCDINPANGVTALIYTFLVVGQFTLLAQGFNYFLGRKQAEELILAFICNVLCSGAAKDELAIKIKNKIDTFVNSVN